MSDAPTPTPATTPETPASAASVQVPEGYVPAADLERVEGQRRGFQAEAERLKAELARATATPPAPLATGEGFDPNELIRRMEEIQRNTLAASALQASVPNLRAEFPHADPNLFSSERLAGFASPEALRAVVEADHNRIAAAAQAAADAREAELKAQLGTTQGGNPGGPIAPPTPGTDPTTQQLAAMSTAELDAYEAANPGVIARVMSAAMAAQG